MWLQLHSSKHSWLPVPTKTVAFCGLGAQRVGGGAHLLTVPLKSFVSLTTYRIRKSEANPSLHRLSYSGPHTIAVFKDFTTL